MIHAQPLRTRGTECGPDRWVTLPAVISMMEDLRWEWLREPDLGFLERIHEGHGFFVTEQHVAMCRRFGSGIDATISGVLRRVGRVQASADQALIRDDGVLLAHCRITGVWMGPDGRLARIPRRARDFVVDEPIASVRGAGEPGSATSLFDPPQPLRPGGLDLPLDEPVPEHAHRRTLQVRATDCDIFQHVNAANYVRYIADSLAFQGASPSLHRAHLRYTGQARALDEVDVHTWMIDGPIWGAAVTREDEVLFRTTVETEIDPR
jgi:acyl-CoA thioesterase FadM